ncbi:uncharacterized protein KQ657_002375 [Scheffersomyces spartinae]|uniref:Uncharacterized protein n=1 Tax=Scheffersomyces spartinae TaxID=45513 RepID=A0A9P7VD86_9ASCO|nr:uncharacterized protein KQ657_002375 [Scheffersomyces spartinae]KAG7195988.1 hypothetical protein KQ657_002375 [Scheffersomyces spartinae]
MSRRVVGNPVIGTITAISLIIGGWGLLQITGFELPENLAGAGCWQFLTNLSLLYTLLVFAIGTLAHMFQSPVLYSLKNYLHPIALALESVVALVYWPLRLFKPQLILTRDFFLPMDVDLAIHLLPVVSLSIDYFLFMPKWLLSHTSAFLFVTSLAMGYYLLLKQLVDVENGAIYPYQFLNVDTELERIVIFFIVGLTGFLQYLFLQKLYDVIVDGEYNKLTDNEKIKKTT